MVASLDGVPAAMISSQMRNPSQGCLIHPSGSNWHPTLQDAFRWLQDAFSGRDQAAGRSTAGTE
jgi:hypothetical protein